MSRYHKVKRGNNWIRIRSVPRSFCKPPARPLPEGLCITLFLPKVFPGDEFTQETLDLCSAADVKRWHWWIDLYAGKVP